MALGKKIKPEKIKAKSTAKLKSMGIDIIEHLPHLEAPSFRDPQEVAKRMMVLLALYQLHLEAPTEIIKGWLKDNGLLDKLTKEEKFFLKIPFVELAEHHHIDIDWYLETIWAFAWVGGFHENLSFKTGAEDTLAPMLPNIEINESASPFIESFSIRDAHEIFEMLDQFYRANWFARNLNLTGKTSDKVNLDLIMERRKALEFVCYAGVKWDRISLDT